MSRLDATARGILAALGSLEAFSPFGEAELRELAAHCEIVNFDAGVALISEGEDSDNRVYFILSGTVSVFVNERFILRLNQRGDIVGEMSLVSDEPRSATVKTDGPSRFLVISTSSALGIKTGEDDDYRLKYYFARMFCEIMAGKLRVTSERAKLYEDAILHTRRIEAHSSVLEDRIAHNLRQIQLYSHLIASAKDAIVIVTMDGIVESANPALAEVFGVDIDKIIGTPVGELLGLDEDGDSSWEHTAEVARDEGWKGEVMVQFTDDGECPADCTVSLVRLADQSPLAYSAMLRDSRERKAYQDRILGQQLALEGAYKDLQGLDALKDRFLSRVSHELRTPLTSMLGALEMLAIPGMVETDEQQPYFDMVLSEAQRLAGLVDKVLSISKIESGHMLFDFQRARLDELVGIEVSRIRPRTDEKNLAMILEIDSPIEEMCCDEKQIMTVVAHILENAIKFTESGTIRITVSQSDEESIIRIEDTGRGIDKINIGRIFNKLGQLEDNSDQARGLGLGLPLCHLIVHAHSGRLLVNSEPGKGSIFTVGLPRNLPVTAVTPEIADVHAG